MSEVDHIASREALLGHLGERVCSRALARRLDIEATGGRPLRGRSGIFAYLEEWVLTPSMMRAAFRFAGLYERGRANALDIRVTGHRLASPRLPATFHGLRLLHLSDLHIDMSFEFEARLQELIAGLSFDLCVITGDLRYEVRGDPRPALEAMARLRPRLGDRALLVLGNHDSVRWVPFLESRGYEVLLNETTEIRAGSERLQVAGVDDRGYFAADDLAVVSERLSEAHPALLLSHTPDIVLDRRVAGFDFVLCGHTHGGQVSLPGGWPLVTNARCARRFCRGPWRHGDVQGYTSAGAGASLLDVRFNCPAEITVHELAGEPARGR